MNHRFDDSGTFSTGEEMGKNTQPAAADDGGKISAGLRAKTLFVLSVLVFIFAVVMCLSLIKQSGELEPIPTIASDVHPIEYEVNVPPTQPITRGEDDTYQLELKAPVSAYDSPLINILLLGVEGDKNDTQILCSVNLSERSLSLLSIPRDTYIAGDYDSPKAKEVYASFAEDLRIDAVLESVRGMFGFAPDYYFVLDEATLSQMVTMAGGVSFHVPDSPDYHGLKSGLQTIDGKNAFELFRFKKSWEDVETDPARVQRNFLVTLFSRLLEDRSKISENCVKLTEVAKTDLTAGELAYIAYLLEEYDFNSAFSRALPGKAKEIGKETYYEIDPESAVDMLNEHFNPLKKELTVFTVNFRQEQGASGEGEFSDYGHSSSTTVAPSSDDNSDDNNGDPDNEDETDPTDDSTETENTEETESSEATEPPTEEEPTTEPTQAPEETQDTGSNETQTP